MREEALDITCWYAIHTKPNQEERASQNLIAWGVETFLPLLRKRSFEEHVARAVYRIEPLFRSYIFARCNASNMLYKVGRCLCAQIPDSRELDATPEQVAGRRLRLLRE